MQPATVSVWVKHIKPLEPNTVIYRKLQNLKLLHSLTQLYVQAGFLRKHNSQPNNLLQNPLQHVVYSEVWRDEDYVKVIPEGDNYVSNLIN